MRFSAKLAVVAALALFGQAAWAQNVEAIESTIEAILSGDRETQSPAVCDLLQSGVVAEVFEVDPAALNFRPASRHVRQALCTASWAKMEVSLTVIKPRFDSSEAAVQNLESTVARLEEGFTIKVAGRERTTQVDFDDWTEGVGDKAAWAPRLNELSVAAQGMRFAVTVQGASGEGENRDWAILLARRISSEL